VRAYFTKPLKLVLASLALPDDSSGRQRLKAKALLNACFYLFWVAGILSAGYVTDEVCGKPRLGIAINRGHTIAALKVQTVSCQ